MFSLRPSRSGSNLKLAVSFLALISLFLVSCSSSVASPTVNPPSFIAAGSPTVPATALPSTNAEATVSPVPTIPSATPTPLHTAAPTPQDTATPIPNPCIGPDAYGATAQFMSLRINLPSLNPRQPVSNILPDHFGVPGVPSANGGYDTATNLGNGEVLFVGGGNLGDRATVYVASGSESADFVDTGSLLVGRRNPLAALLPNNKVLIIGGGPVTGCVGHWFTEVEVYDPGSEPANGHFITLNTSTPPDPLDPATSPLAHAQDLENGRGYTNLTTLADGRILLWGGQFCGQTYTSPSNCTPISEIYDSSVGPNGTFTATQAPIPFGQGSTATLLANGQVLFAGGGTETNTITLPSSDAGLYDPSNDSYVATSSLTTPRDGATAVLLGGGDVLISGGSDDAGNVLASAEIYDPTASAFQPTTQPMTTVRLGHTATLLSDGQHVLIVGGQSTFGDSNNLPTYLASAELYDVNTGIFSATAGSTTVTRWPFTSTLLIGGTVLVVGAKANSNISDYSADLYLP